MLIAGVAGLWSSYRGLLWGLSAGAHNHSILFVLAWMFPALTIVAVLIYLRAPTIGLSCSWLLLAGGFCSYYLLYRNTCIEHHVANGDLLMYGKCTLILATHLRGMFASALCLELAYTRDPVDQLLRKPTIEG